MLERFRSTNPFLELRREMDRVFEEFGSESPWSHGGRRSHFPALNIWDEGERLLAEAEVPGVRHEDLEIYALGNELTIKGRRPAISEEGRVVHRQERAVGEFTRTVTLPVEVNSAQMEAELHDGVLLVRMPKAEKAVPKRIEVKAS